MSSQGRQGSGDSSSSGYASIVSREGSDDGDTEDAEERTSLTPTRIDPHHTPSGSEYEMSVMTNGSLPPYSSLAIAAPPEVTKTTQLDNGISSSRLNESSMTQYSEFSQTDDQESGNTGSSVLFDVSANGLAPQPLSGDGDDYRAAAEPVCRLDFETVNDGRAVDPVKFLLEAGDYNSGCHSDVTRQGDSGDTIDTGCNTGGSSTTHSDSYPQTLTAANTNCVIRDNIQLPAGDCKQRTISVDIDGISVSVAQDDTPKDKLLPRLSGRSGDMASGSPANVMPASEQPTMNLPKIGPNMILPTIGQPRSEEQEEHTTSQPDMIESNDESDDTSGPYY